ncbi:MAG: NUDIX hydrolase [Candidatus Paceibacterota bacterium]
MYPPAGFKPKFHIVSCFIEDPNGEILLLLRQDQKPQGNTWGVPAGKVGVNENHLVAVVREINEETGYIAPTGPDFFETVFVCYPEYDFVYHIFHIVLQERIDVVINPKEHKMFKWVKPKDALSMPLIGGLDECIKIFYRH